MQGPTASRAVAAATAIAASLGLAADSVVVLHDSNKLTLRLLPCDLVARVALAAVADHYPGLDPQRLNDCRILMLAMIITWRWDRHDRLPNGSRFAEEWTNQLRVSLRGAWPDGRPTRP